MSPCVREAADISVCKSNGERGRGREMERERERERESHFVQVEITFN
jgi:hypothetical protein